ncbi:beta-galactosidase-like [Carica papaya]|uniref:beta-galactosidase-like n=1 Tax=Carica papaya TaxID=3649 RepID=UPI000B8D0B7A|nr:beta-galactosidase-like [Carica papaya]
MAHFCWIELLVLATLALVGSSLGARVESDSNAIIIDGQRKIIISGSIHYPRSTPQMWPDLIQKGKDGGLDAIETYIFWDIHEPNPRQYDFSGNKDFIKFFQLIQQAGLYAILRIGPYVCAEWSYGGFPLWLHNTPGIQLRTDNEIYKNEMQIFTSKIVSMCKDAKLFAPQGGPIILAQIENEYGNIMKGYGAAGKSYINWAAQMAVNQNIGIPWVMCQQDDAPQPMINACNGFYCDQFKPNNPKSPKMWTENWTGWFKLWGNSEPHRPAEDVAFAVARFFQNGGVLNNYYMYHGGTNFGRKAGGPYITTSYDYDAPLDEYGNLNQPKWGHLKQLHAAIKQGEKILTSGTATTRNVDHNIDLTTYANNAGERFCFLSNIDGSKDVNVDLQQDGKFMVPAWSVSILLGCKTEIYNTAKVYTPTVVYAKKNQDPTKLSWAWVPEAMDETLDGKGDTKANELLDQKDAASDASDYLWYMTSVNIDANTPRNANLRVTTNGHGLHAFVNKNLIGFQFAGSTNGQQSFNGDDYSFEFQRPVQLNVGTNIISLLSVTVGLANYGVRYDLIPTGLWGKTVQLMAGTTTINLTSSTWFNKVGVNGESQRLYDPSSNVNWNSNQLPTARPFTWYKTTFKSPWGTAPVVVDLQGMGKGHAWVNGNSIGRYWANELSGTRGCVPSCNYRGGYRSDNCRTNCGNPSQRWYHIPRSFLNNNVNTLILFEELGGDTSQVAIQVVTPQ